MKKIKYFVISLIILIVSVCPLYSGAVYNDQVSFEANIVLLESLDRDTVIFNKNSALKTAPASLTKITTAMVVLENCKDLNAVVTTKKEIIRSFDGKNSSNAGISVGEELTVHKLLECMLVKSANEAASILADYVGGDIDTFVQMMNDYAAKLGCKNTHYVNPHGLDDNGQYTTADDLSIIVKAALKNKTFVELTNTTTITIPQNNVRTKEQSYNTTNYLISPHSQYYYEYASGIKTGTTDSAGHCLISTATKNGYTYLCIIMQAPAKDVDNDGADENLAFVESKTAYEWAFSNIKLKVVAEPTDVITVANVNLARKVDHVRLVPKEKVTALVPYNIDSSSILIEPVEKSIGEVTAPVKKGDVIGKANVMYANEVICVIDLVAGEDVNRSFFAYLGYLIKSALQTTIAKIILCIIILVIIIIISLNIYFRNNKKRKRIKIVKNYRNIK